MCDIKNKIKLAKKSIVLIDDFVDEATIDVLDIKNPEAGVLVLSKNRLMLQIRNVRRRKKFKSGFDFFQVNNFRNMYLLIDDKFLFMLSRPIRYNEKRSFWFIQIMDIREIKRVREMVQSSYELAQKQYRHF